MLLSIIPAFLFLFGVSEAVNILLFPHTMRLGGNVAVLRCTGIGSRFCCRKPPGQYTYDFSLARIDGLTRGDIGVIYGKNDAGGANQGCNNRILRTGIGPSAVTANAFAGTPPVAAQWLTCSQSGTIAAIVAQIRALCRGGPKTKRKWLSFQGRRDVQAREAEAESSAEPDELQDVYPDTAVVSGAEYFRQSDGTYRDVNGTVLDWASI